MLFGFIMFIHCGYVSFYSVLLFRLLYLFFPLYFSYGFDSVYSLSSYCCVVSPCFSSLVIMLSLSFMCCVAFPSPAATNASQLVFLRSNDDQASPPAMGKLTPDLLAGNHYEADISDQSDGCLGVPQG